MKPVILTRGALPALLALPLFGLGACDLKTDYTDTAVQELTPLQQIGFCRDAAYEMSRSYIGSFRSICALSALDPETCVENFDECAADFDPDLVSERSKGAVLGADSCRELFDEDAFAGCEINAAQYVACVTETAVYLGSIDGEVACSERDEEESQRMMDEATRSCADMATLCPENPFTVEDIAEAVAEENNGTEDGNDEGDAGPASDAGPEEDDETGMDAGTP